MNKKSTKALASATLMSLVLTTALTAGPVKAAAGSATRVSGADRYETAANVATSNWTTSDNVVLVSGQGYADAVSASALAKQLNAPILLTTPDTLSSTTQAALTKLQAKNIYVVGGTASVSQSVRDGLKSSGYALTELSGNTRYETNVAVANELVKLGVKKDNVLVVGGNGFSDALSVAPIASAKGEILLLADNDQSDSKGAIDFANGSNVTVVGTSNVISDAIKGDFSSTATRVDGGADRFATNLNVLNNFKSDLKTDKLYVANASGNGYADALVASAIAGKTASPLVLVDTDSSDATTNAINYMKGEATKTTDTEVVGGTGVVSDTLLGNINSAIYGTTPTTSAQVQSVSAVDLNQFKVVFNQEVDQDTAEDENNYEVDGAQLDSTNAVATLQDDNKTVLVTLKTPRKQSDSVDIKVKKGILSSDKSQTIPEFTQSSLTFTDTTAPTLVSATARGNNKLSVVFSEPVNMKSINDLANKMKINGQNISGFGLDEATGSNAASEIKDSIAGNNSGEVWSDKVDFYFNSALPTGNNTLKVSTGDQSTSSGAGILSDAAGFPFQEASINFNVDTLTTEPQITSLTADDSGKVYINFDRPMDAKSVQSYGYFKINDTTLSTSNSTIELKKDDTQIKISDVGTLLKKGSNTVYIDKNVKDAYGNKFNDNVRKSVDLTEDDTKPAVTSVVALNDNTIRVRFNKDVDATYAKEISNYKLKDNGGNDITGEIDYANITIPGGKSTDKSGDVFDIPLTGTNKLNDSKYTITIKNIIDTTSTKHVMDDYTTTFDGSNDVAPTVQSNAYQVAGQQHKVVVYFDQEMDGSSLTDTSSYKYENLKGDVKSLPSGTSITTSSDNKSATIEFPDSYYLNGDSTIPSATDQANIVKYIDVIGVKDSKGTALDVSKQATVVSQSTASTTITSSTTTVKQKSFKLYYDGNNLKADVEFTQPIDNLDYTEFRINGVEPDSGYKNGQKVTFVFNDASKLTANDSLPSTIYDKAVATNADYSVTLGDGTKITDKIDAVKLLGSQAELTVSGGLTTKTTDVSGNKVTSAVSGTSAVGLPVWYNDAAPKTIADSWRAGIVGDTVSGTTIGADANPTVGTTGDGYVDVAFDTPIDASSVKTDDFTFNINGAKLTADDVQVIKYGTNPTNTVRFIFHADAAKFVTRPTISVSAKATVSIRTPQDNNGDNATYAPSSDDTNIRTIVANGIAGAIGSDD